MKSFEQEVKKRIILVSLFAVLGGLVIAAAFIIQQSGVFGAENGLPLEVLAGLFFGIEATSCFRILKYRKALSGHEELEFLHVKETDERNCIIALKTCRSCIYSAFALLGVAAIVSSFFSRTVFLTTGAVLIVLVLLYGMFRLYFSGKI